MCFCVMVWGNNFQISIVQVSESIQKVGQDTDLNLDLWGEANFMLKLSSCAPPVAGSGLRW